MPCWRRVSRWKYAKGMRSRMLPPVAATVNLPEFVEQQCRELQMCGVLAHGFARFRCAVGAADGLA